MPVFPQSIKLARKPLPKRPQQQEWKQFDSRLGLWSTTTWEKCRLCGARMHRETRKESVIFLPRFTVVSSLLDVHNHSPRRTSGSVMSPRNAFSTKPGAAILRPAKIVRRLLSTVKTSFASTWNACMGMRLPRLRQVTAKIRNAPTCPRFEYRASNDAKSLLHDQPGVAHPKPLRILPYGVSGTQQLG
jgi:hypothetical protein